MQAILDDTAMDASPSPVMGVDQLPDAVHRWNTGDKWQGSFGVTELLTTDYWTLRARSAQLFKQSHHARGILRRLVQNVIHTGLHLEAQPQELALGYDLDSLAEWSDTVEDQFELWAASPDICDALGEDGFGALQAAAFLEALIEGDCLIVLEQEPTTRLPRVRLVPGSRVQSPLETPQNGNRIVHGVELDRDGRKVAFWTRDAENKARRIPAVGPRTGQRLAWLIYGTDKRYDEVRGEPLLGVLLHSLRELDRYRDASVRKAVVNSIVALFVTQGEQRSANRSPIGRGAVVRGTETTTDSSGAAKSYKVAEYEPGFVVENLPYGSELKSFGNTGTDEKLGTFQDAILSSIAWALGIPLELLKLSFNSNYSASQAALNEFRMLLTLLRTRFGEAFCHPVYKAWLLAEQRRHQTKVTAPGLLEASRDPSRFDVVAAWTFASFAGSVKPAMDMAKLTRAYASLLDMGTITFDRAARELTGMSFRQVVRQQRKERELLAEARLPLPLVAAGELFPAFDDVEDDDQDDDQDDENKEEDDDTKAKVVPLRQLRLPI